MQLIIAKLFDVFYPPIAAYIQRRLAEHNGQFPTPAEAKADFLANSDKYIGEGEAWLAANPPASGDGG